MAPFGPKPWVNPFGKMSIFRLFGLLVFIALTGVFSLQNILKTFFSPIFPKKKIAKMAIFGPKPWVNLFGKVSIFALFQLLFFIPQKGVFPLQNIVKDIFLPYISNKKKLGKWPFLDRNHGLTPLEKRQFFDFLNCLFLQPRKEFFRSRIS